MSVPDDAAGAVTCPQCRGQFPSSGNPMSMCPHCGNIVLTRPRLQLPSQPPASRNLADVPVECKLCGTRYYARKSQIGQLAKCPDCHSDNLIEAVVTKQTTGPTISDDDEFELSEPVETPKYEGFTRDAAPLAEALRDSPLQLPPPPAAPNAPPAGSNEAVQPPVRPKLTLPPRPTPPAPPPTSAPIPSPQHDDIFQEFTLGPSPAPVSMPTAVHPTTPSIPSAPKSSDDDIFLEDDLPTAPAASQPVAPPANSLARQPNMMRLEIPAEPPPPKGTPEASPNALPAMFEPARSAADAAAERIGPSLDEQIRAAQKKVAWFERDSGDYGAWEWQPGEDLTLGKIRRHPFSAGILSVLKQPQIMARGFGFVVPLAVVLPILNYSLQNPDGDAMREVVNVVLALAMSLALIPLLIAIAIFCETIFQDTANGQDLIESWPEFSLFDWLGESLYFATAIVFSGWPGALLAVLAVCGGGPMWISVFLLWPSVFLLFPVLFISMQEAGSIFTLCTRRMVGSFRALSRFWGGFYFSTFLLLIAMLILLPLMYSNGTYTIVAGLPFLMAMPILYFRLLGRMAMIYRDYVADLEEKERDASEKAADS